MECRSAPLQEQVGTGRLITSRAPFDDGNARSAFLALVFVLAREGVALNGVILLRRITFQADDPRDALTLTRYIEVHLAETRRSTSSHGS